MPKHPHILNAASNLLGIALVIIVGLDATHVAEKSWSDEVAWVAAISLLISCLCSYLAMRHSRFEHRFESLADGSFLVGLLGLFGSVLVLALQWR